MDGVINNDCSLNCDNLHIFLNNTDKYTNASGNPDGVNSEFFVIDDYFYTDETIGDYISIHAYNLLDILNYELGSFLGLGIPIGLGADFAGCINDGIFNANLNKLKSTFMSDDDKCMIINKYCNPTSIQEIIIPYEYITILTGDKLQIIFPESKRPLKIEIFSMLGQSIKTYNLDENSVLQSHFDIDLKDFISGSYIIAIFEKNEQISFSNFVIVK